MAIGAFRMKGWKAAAARGDTHSGNAVKWGKINYVVYREPSRGAGKYCADVKGTGKARTTTGYRMRNEGAACALKPADAIAKAVRNYFAARKRKVRSRPR